MGPTSQRLPKGCWRSANFGHDIPKHPCRAMGMFYSVEVHSCLSIFGCPVFFLTPIIRQRDRPSCHTMNLVPCVQFLHVFCTSEMLAAFRNLCPLFGLTMG